MTSLLHHSATAHKVAATVTARSCVVIVLGLSSVVTARALHPAGRGTYGLILAFAWVAAAVGHLSIEQSNVLRWHRGDDHRAIASTSLVLGLFGGVVAALVGWLIVTHTSANPFSASDGWLIALVLPAVPLNIVGGYLIGLCVLDDRVGRTNAARGIAASLQLLFLVGLWLTHHLTVATALAVWVATLGVLPVLILAPGLSIRPHLVSARLTALLVRTGLKYHLGMAALFLLRRVDVLMLNALVSRREVGLYVVAVVLAELVFLPAESIAQVVLPRQVVGSLAEAADYTARITRLNTIIGLTVMAGLAALSPFVIRIAFGTSYSGSVAPLLALLPGVLAVGLTRPITAMLVRLDRPFVVSLICICALGLNVSLIFLLVPTLGIVGASVASSVAYAAQAAAYTRWLLRSTPLKLSDLRPGRSDLMLLLALMRRRQRTSPAAP